MVNRISGAVAAALLAAGLSPAGAADLLVAIKPPGVLDEVLLEPRVTAEAVIVGLVLPKASGDAAAASRSVLAAIPPEARASGVCLRIVTSDGLYEGRGEFVAAGPGSEAVALLPYETEKTVIFEYPDDDVAALVRPCGGDGTLTEVAIATWAADGGQPLGDVAELLVNSFRADQAFVTIGDGPPHACEALSEGPRAAFDFRCRIPIRLLENGAALTLFRVRGASLDPQVDIDVIGWK